MVVVVGVTDSFTFISAPEIDSVSLKLTKYLIIICVAAFALLSKSITPITDPLKYLNLEFWFLEINLKVFNLFVSKSSYFGWTLSSSVVDVILFIA